MKRDKMKMKMKDERSRAKPPSKVAPVTITKGINGLDKIILREAHGSSAEIYLHGAQVTSWKNEHGEELLFVSSKANFSSDMSVRGGIPIVFPQFLDLGFQKSLEFVRNGFWCIDCHPQSISTDTASGAYVDLILKPNEVDLRMWPHSFEFRLRVSLSRKGDLMLTSRIKNPHTERRPLKFMFAYNTYLSVSDIRKIQVEGLETLHYHDNIRNKELVPDRWDELTFEAEVDNTYLRTPSTLAILDYNKKRAIEIRKEGIPDAFVWNPGDKKAKAMADLGKKDYNLMLCVGAAVAENPVTVKPGYEWTGKLELTAVNATYNKYTGTLVPPSVTDRYRWKWLK